MTRRYKTSATRRSSRRFAVAFSAPVDKTEIEALLAKIEREEKFIAAYEANYKWLADEARARLAHHRAKLAELNEQAALSQIDELAGEERFTINQMIDGVDLFSGGAQ